MRFSAPLKANIARAVAVELAALKKKKGAPARCAFYATAFTKVADDIDVALGATGAWKKGKSDQSVVIKKLDEYQDFYLMRLYRNIEAATTLVLNEPDSAQAAEKCLNVLFPLATLGDLLGLPPDREAAEVSKLLATAKTDAMKKQLAKLGVDGDLPKLQKIVNQIKTATSGRAKTKKSGGPGAVKTAEAFEPLWQKFEGFLKDAFNLAKPADAATVTALRSSYQGALDREHAIDLALATRAAKKQAAAQKSAQGAAAS